jgi:hypothetical protein
VKAQLRSNRKVFASKKAGTKKAQKHTVIKTEEKQIEPIKVDMQAKRKPAATATAPKAAESSASDPHVALVGKKRAEPAAAPAERGAPAADNLTLNFARKKSEIKNNIITPDQDKNSSSASPESRKEEEFLNIKLT